MEKMILQDAKNKIDGMEAAAMENELTKSPLTDEEARKVTGGGMKNPWESMEEQRASVLPLADREVEGAAGGMAPIKEREGFF